MEQYQLRPGTAPTATIRIPVSVIGVPIDALTWDKALTTLSESASAHESRYVCFCNVHSVVTATQDKDFLEVIRGADMATPDGAPIAWMLRLLGYSRQQRINGPDLMWRYCEMAARRNESIFLYGSTQETLDLLQVKLKANFPCLIIAGAISPPFRPLTEAEDAAVVDAVNASGAGTLWVSLGCPKQERWMAEHRGRINAVMLGVGAAFDYHAGSISRAPQWMRHSGLEWLHRLASEPGRLWKRYLFTNTTFLLAALRQLLRRKAGI